MRSAIRTSVMLAGACLLCAGATANAAETNVVDVKIPFAFMVNGQTLPAGAYVMQRDMNFPSALWIRGENGNHAAAIVLTDPASGRDPAGNGAVVTFAPYENQQWLSSVWASGTQGWTVAGR